MTHKPKIAVSACLLGHPVRYDGQTKEQPLIVDFLLKQCSDKVDVVAFCPEVSIGLGVPRAKIQLVKKNSEQIHVLGVENHRLDVTDLLKSYAETFLQQYPEIKNYIVKSKSPSCGFQSSPLFELAGQKNNDYQQIAFSSGVFVQSLLALRPELQIIEESLLTNREACCNFINNLKT